MHLKRQSVPKNWPVFRKGTKYVVRPTADIQKSIPLLIVLRDMLKVVQNRKEAKKAIHMKHILINNKNALDEKNSLYLFDTISIVPSKKHYRLDLTEKGKFELAEMSEKETNHKIAKIINKKMLRGKKTQLNLSDGRNFLSEAQCSVDDSVLINFKEKKIEKCIPLKEGTNAVVFAGKHAGKKGKLTKVDKKIKMAELKINGEFINVLIKQIMAVE